MRFLNPTSEIRIAGGREVNLRSLQPLGLYPANSIFVSDYLTTPGQAPGDDYRMIEDLDSKSYCGKAIAGGKFDRPFRKERFHPLVNTVLSDCT